MQRIAEALQRLHSTIARRPDFGRRTSSTVTTSEDGLRCSTTARSWTIETDLVPALGGEGSAPSPSVLVSAALGACLAQGYQLRAAEEGIDLTAVRVTVETDTDVSGMLSLDAPAPPGFTGIRYRVEIDSPAPASVIERIVDVADRLSPVLDMLTRPTLAQRTVAINEAVNATIDQGVA
jgi:uncharacterized OsmC-like protein